MKAEGRVQVVVRSRRVPVGTISRTEPIYSASGVLVGSVPTQFVLYGRALDEEHRRAIDEGQRLACNLGLEFEVVDESKTGLFRRMLSFLGGNGSGNASVVVSPSTRGRPDPPQALTQRC